MPRLSVSAVCPATSPVIVVVALNDLEHDGRVRAIAATLARAGARVTVLGVTHQPDGWKRQRDDTQVLVVPWPAARSAVLLDRATEFIDAILRKLRANRQGKVETARSRVRKRRAEVRRARSGPEREVAVAALEAARAELRAARRPNRVHRGVHSSLLALKRQLMRGRRRAWRSRRSPRLRRRHARRTRRRLVAKTVRLRPAAICGNGADGLAVAGVARRRLRLLGRDPVVVYDADEWTVGRSNYTQAEGPPDQVEWEQRWIRTADAVITVSEPLSRVLQEHHRLDSLPALVHSAPRVRNHDTPAPDLARLANLPDAARTLVHVGRIEERRGVGDAISALPLLPRNVHLVLLPTASPRAIRGLVERAEALGVDDRLHFVDPVEPELVVATIRGADLGLLATRHGGQHHVTMPNKLFQYAQAGLPLVCSDGATTSRFVKEHGIGEVFAAGDPEALAAAVSRALGRKDEIRARLYEPELRHATSWESQEPRLIDAFRAAGALPP